MRLSSPSKQHVCVLTPSITLPMLWNMITNTETLLTLSAIFCSSRSFPLILSVRSSLLLFWKEGERETSWNKKVPPTLRLQALGSVCVYFAKRFCLTVKSKQKNKKRRFGGHILRAAKPTTRKCPLITQSRPKTPKYKLHTRMSAHTRIQVIM